MWGGVEVALLAWDVMTLLSSGLNAGYFFGYRSVLRGRRIGAKALALVATAAFLDALQHGLVLAAYGPDVSPTSISPGLSVLVRGLMAAGSVFISLLVLKQRRMAGGKRRSE